MSTRSSALVTLLLTLGGVLYVVAHQWMVNSSLLYMALKGAGVTAVIFGYGMMVVHSFHVVVVKKDEDIWTPKRRKTDRK